MATTKKEEKTTLVDSTDQDTQKIKGVDNATTDTINSPFVASEAQQTAQADANNAKSKVETLTSKDSIVSQDVKDTLNSTYTKSPEILQTEAYLKTQLGKIQSGKTSYSDKVREMMSKIEGRDKFSYDVDSDPLFQQALASAMNSGKSAMQDTIGQASALTGGYGSTYATSAANQAYNAFIEDAYDNLPQYYQMAMEAYQMEGDEMYRQLGMYNDADATEYNRLLTAYDATYQHRNQMYNEEYQQFRDSKTDAYNMANLQISEHGQLVSDAVNYYNISSDYADTMYNREYKTWEDEVNKAMWEAEMYNKDYWKNEEYEQKEDWNQKDLDEKQRQFNYSIGDTNNDGVVDEKEEAIFNYNPALEEQKRQFNITHGDTNGDGNLSAEEIAAYNKQAAEPESKTGYVTREEDGKKVEYKLPTESQNQKALEAWNKDIEANKIGEDGKVMLTNFNQYLDSLSGVDEDTIMDYVNEHGYVSFEERTYTKTTDSMNGFLWLQNFGENVDQGDIVEDNYGNKYDLADLQKMGVSKDFLMKLTNLKKGGTYKK